MKRFFILLFFLVMAVTPVVAWNSEAEIRNYYEKKINYLKSDLANVKAKVSSGGDIFYNGAASAAIPGMEASIQKLIDEMNQELQKFRNSHGQKQNNGSRGSQSVQQSEIEAADNARILEERRQREESERLAKKRYDEAYNNVMDSTRPMYDKQILRADKHAENMDILRSANLNPYNVESKFIPSTSGSNMAVKHSKSEITLPTKRGNAYSNTTVVVDLDKYPSTQLSQPYSEDFKTITLPRREWTIDRSAGDAWDKLKQDNGERKWVLLAVNLWELNKEELPNFRCYNKDGSLTFTSSDGNAIYFVSPDASQIESFVLTTNDHNFMKDGFDVETILELKARSGILEGKVSLSNKKELVDTVVQVSGEKHFLETVSDKSEKKSLINLSAKGKLQLVDDQSSFQKSLVHVNEALSIGSHFTIEYDGLKAGVEGSVSTNGVKLEAKASLLEVSEKVSGKTVLKINNTYYTANFEADSNAGIGYKYKAERKINKSEGKEFLNEVIIGESLQTPLPVFMSIKGKANLKKVNLKAMNIPTNMN